MNSYKAHGLDGIHAYFLKIGSNSAQTTLFNFAHEVFHSLDKTNEVTQTFLCLIPEKDLVVRVIDFRPISLCNAL